MRLINREGLKMKKKLIALALCVMLLMTAGLSTALADRGPSQSEMAALYSMVNAANYQIALMVRTAQATPWDDVAWVQYSTNCVARSVQAYARSIGATVVCEYEYYYIDGQYVAIDPLRVINV